MATIEELRDRLTPQQQMAAELLVANEFAGKEKRTQDEIANEVGISRQQLYTWRTKNADFAEYFRRVADLKMNSLSVAVDARLMDLILKGPSNNGIPSIKAIETYYKRFGLLVDRKEITTRDESKPKRLTQEEVARGLEELNEMLDEGNK